MSRSTSDSTAWRYRGQRWDTDMFDKHILGGCGATLHAIQHNGVRACLDGQRDIELDTGGADLDQDRNLVVGDLPKFVNLDLQIIRPGPVRMPASTALVDSGWKISHLRDAFGDFLSEQHAATARLRALTDYDLERVGTTHVIRIQTIARWQYLIDQRLR